MGLGITVPPVRGEGDLGHVNDSNLVRDSLLTLDIFTWDESVGRVLLARRSNGTNQLVYGDTGWRTGLPLMNGWSASTVYMRRTMFDVHVVLANLNPSAATGSQFMSIPMGFRPAVQARFAVNASPAIAAYRVQAGVGAEAGESFSLPDYLAMGVPVSFYAVYGTTNVWPTSLPGTASGSIPSAFASSGPDEFIPTGWAD